MVNFKICDYEFKNGNFSVYLKCKSKDEYDSFPDIIEFDSKFFFKEKYLEVCYMACFKSEKQLVRGLSKKEYNFLKSDK